MAFQQHENVTVVDIGDFEEVLFVPQAIDAENPQTGVLTVQLIMSDGSIRTKKFNLLVRLQDDAAGLIHLANLADQRDYIKARLIAEVLP